MELCNYPCRNRICEFDIEAIQIPIVYNKYGDHDPDGLLYVLAEDAERIKEGALRNFHKEIPQMEQVWDSIRIVLRGILLPTPDMRKRKGSISFRTWRIREAERREPMYTVCLVLLS